MIRWKQGGAGFDDWGLKFGNPNFVDYTNSYGATGHRLSSAKDLIPMINQAFKTGGTHLIDVPIDYSQNKRLLIDELRINHRVPSNSKE
jgi:acetolactate synthase-1/2/3 large subunit